jgi:hypothetical protein
MKYFASDSIPFSEPQELADMIIGCVHQRLLAEKGLSGTPILDFRSFKNGLQQTVEKKMRLLRQELYSRLQLDSE